MTKIKPKDKPHYVNNRDFSEAVYDHVLALNEAKANETPRPQVSTYIGKCFLRICEGLAHRSNFIHYPFRDEMVMDAVENCLKAINNYDISKVTRTGKPNAFSYFTQISWFAFLRRIAKEKRQLDIKTRLVERSGYDEFFDGDDDANGASGAVDRLRSNFTHVQTGDNVKPAAEAELVKPKKPVGLEHFIGGDD